MKEIKFQDLAKPSCKKCYGTGSIGRDAATKKPIACACAIKNYVKLKTHLQQRIAREQLSREITKLKQPWWRRLFSFPKRRPV